MAHRNWSDEVLCNLNGYIYRCLKNDTFFHWNYMRFTTSKIQSFSTVPCLNFGAVPFGQGWFVDSFPIICLQGAMRGFFLICPLPGPESTWREDVKKSCIGTTFSRWYFQIISFEWSITSFSWVRVLKKKWLEIYIIFRVLFCFFIDIYIYDNDSRSSDQFR